MIPVALIRKGFGALFVLLVLYAITMFAVLQPNKFRLLSYHLSLGFMVLSVRGGSGRIKLLSFVLSIVTNIIALLLLLFTKRGDKDFGGLSKRGKPSERDQYFYGGVTLSTFFVALSGLAKDNEEFKYQLGVSAALSYLCALLIFVIQKDRNDHKTTRIAHNGP